MLSFTTILCCNCKFPDFTLFLESWECLNFKCWRVQIYTAPLLCSVLLLVHNARMISTGCWRTDISARCVNAYCLLYVFPYQCHSLGSEVCCTCCLGHTGSHVRLLFIKHCPAVWHFLAARSAHTYLFPTGCRAYWLNGSKSESRGKPACATVVYLEEMKQQSHPHTLIWNSYRHSVHGCYSSRPRTLSLSLLTFPPSG